MTLSSHHWEELRWLRDQSAATNVVFRAEGLLAHGQEEAAELLWDVIVDERARADHPVRAIISGLVRDKAPDEAIEHALHGILGAKITSPVGDACRLLATLMVERGAPKLALGLLEFGIEAVLRARLFEPILTEQVVNSAQLQLFDADDFRIDVCGRRVVLPQDRLAGIAWAEKLLADWAQANTELLESLYVAGIEVLKRLDRRVELERLVVEMLTLGPPMVVARGACALGDLLRADGRSAYAENAYRLAVEQLARTRLEPMDLPFDEFKLARLLEASGQYGNALEVWAALAAEVGEIVELRTFARHRIQHIRRLGQ